MTDVETETWKGPDRLRDLLVPLSLLAPFPDNPNRGDVAAVRASFERFGQLKPIVVQFVAPAEGEDDEWYRAGEDRYRIVAGHTMTAGATELGWTHIAAVANDFENEEEARAYLLADNRTSELGFIDDEALAVQLAALRDYAGTGYSQVDRTQLEERLAALRAERDGFRRMDGDDFQPDGSPPPRLDERSATSGTFEVPLLLSREDRSDFARLIGILKREWGIEDTTAVVVRAVREAAAST